MSRFIERLDSRQYFAFTGGSVDTSFNDGDVTTVRFSSPVSGDRVVPVRLLADGAGRGYVVARVSGQIQIRRVTNTGVVEGYGRTNDAVRINVANSLFKSTSVGGVDAEFDVGNSLYVLAGAKLYRFTANGRADTSWGDNGLLDLSGELTGAKDLAIYGRRVYVAGTIVNKDGSSQMRLLRLRTTDGRLDGTFADRGVFTAERPKYKNKVGSAVGQFIRVASNGTVHAVAAATATLTDGVARVSPLATGVQVAKFLFLNGRDADTSPAKANVAAELFAGTSSRTVTSTPVGIRSDGNVVIAFRNKEFGQAAASYNRFLRGDATYTTPPVSRQFVYNFEGDDVYLADAKFYDANTGSDLIVDGGTRRLYRLIDNGGVQYGTPLDGPGNAAIVDAAQYKDLILTLSPSSNRMALNVGRIFANDTPTAAVSSNTSVTSPGYATFNVTFNSPVGYDTRDIGRGVVSVINDAGTQIPNVRVVDRNFSNNSMILSFRVIDKDGTFTAEDNGFYTVILNTSTRVLDKSGASPSNYFYDRIGGFNVTIR